MHTLSPNPEFPAPVSDLRPACGSARTSTGDSSSFLQRRGGNKGAANPRWSALTPQQWFEGNAQARSMRTIAIWIFGLLASMIVGSMIGLWLLHGSLGSAAWGVAAGALAFACFRPWPSVANDPMGIDPSLSPHHSGQ